MKIIEIIRFARLLILSFGFTVCSVIGYTQFNVPGDYSTIQEAINAASASGGGVVYVDDGIYYESIAIYDKVFVVSVNQNPELAVIDGGGSGNVVVFEACLNGGVVGFTLQNSGSNGQFAAVKIAGDQAPVVAKNIIKGALNGIKIQGNAQPLIINNTVADNLGHGLLAGGNSPATILNNIFVFNDSSGISMNGGAIDLLEYNCVFGNTVDYDNINAGENDISEDPLFVASDDFHLQDLSPCKNAGNTFSDEVTDMGAFGGDIDIENDYLSETYLVSGDVVTNLGLSILVPGSKKAASKTTVTRADRATYGLSKKKSSTPQVITYIVFSEIAEGEVTLDFAETGFDQSTVEIYKVDVENSEYLLQGTSSTSVNVSATDLNGIWMVKGQQTTNIETAQFSDINIFPNPSNGVFNINLGNNRYGAKINVTNLAGRTIHTEVSDKNQITVNMDQQKGVFIMKILDGDKVITKKIVAY